MMAHHRHLSSQYKQQGAVLLLGVLVFIVAGSTAFMLLQPSLSNQQRSTKITYQALMQAKQALIAYAAFQTTPVWSSDTNNNIRPGELPCPDFDNDGFYQVIVDTSGSNCKVYRGWLPYKTLGLPDMHDGSGARLWYGISDVFQANDNNPLNNHTPAALSVDGETVAAVIIAPGAALPHQTGRPPALAEDLSADTVAAQFLEELNQQGDARTPDDTLASQYTAQGTGTFNDIIITITVDELMSVAAAWALDAARNGLYTYYSFNRYYPFATDASGECDAGSTLTSGFLPVIFGACSVRPLDALSLVVSVPPWFIYNQWYSMIYYIADPACVSPHLDCVGGSGPTLSYALNTAQHVLLVAAGNALQDVDCNSVSGDYDQSHPSLNVCDYLEGSANTDGDLQYLSLGPTTRSNDVFLPIRF